ncbi:hypothetical protein R0K18_33460, partial [Pantoea sp. SIMBA_133]
QIEQIEPEALNSLLNYTYPGNVRELENAIMRAVTLSEEGNNEVAAPGEPLPKAGIYDANRFTLMGLLAEHGADVIDLGILPD